MSRDVTLGNFSLWISKGLCILALLEHGKDGEVDLGFSTSWRAVHLDSLLFFLYLRIACEVSQRLTHCLPFAPHCIISTITSISSSNRSYVGKIEIGIYVGCHAWAQVGEPRHHRGSVASDQVGAILE